MHLHDGLLTSVLTKVYSNLSKSYREITLHLCNPESYTTSMVKNDLVLYFATASTRRVVVSSLASRLISLSSKAAAIFITANNDATFRNLESKHTFSCHRLQKGKNPLLLPLQLQLSGLCNLLLDFCQLLLVKGRRSWLPGCCMCACFTPPC